MFKVPDQLIIGGITLFTLQGHKPGSADVYVSNLM